MEFPCSGIFDTILFTTMLDGEEYEMDQLREKRQSRPRTIWLWVMVVSIFGILIPPTVGMLGTFATVTETLETARIAHSVDAESMSRSISQSFATTAMGIAISVGFLALFAFSFAGWIVSGRVARTASHS